jgi:predicted NAD/FAD-binding protein
MKKLAIVGSGIAAMSAVQRLYKDFEITIFEKNNYLGGHTNTHRFNDNGKTVTIDTGFIVFNLKTYPRLVALFKELGVEKRASDMSFAVWNMSTGLQYSGSGLKGIFAQSKNYFSPKHWSFLWEINRFFKVALRDREKIYESTQTIRDYCNSNGLSDYFIENFLAPMSSAVWSTEQNSVYDFPISLLLPFFYNHGLLGVNSHLQWYTVKNGSDQYIKKILEISKPKIHLDTPVQAVEENGENILLSTDKDSQIFDAVLLACHSDEALKITKNFTTNKRSLLDQFKYNKNRAVLHTDRSAMPPEKKAWASWNHVVNKDASGKFNSSTVYWINNLQDIGTNKDYFLSINPFKEIDPKLIVKDLLYDHPNFTVINQKLKPKLHELNTDTRIFFAGAYFGNGFHEDGIAAGQTAADAIKNIILST